MTSSRRKFFPAAWAVCLLAATALTIVTPLGSSNHIDAQEAKALAPDVMVDLNQEAMTVKLSNVGTISEHASTFDTGHTSQSGWAVKVANNNPRSPAAASGVVVVGGGKSHDVFGIDPETGQRKWKAHSKDSGISSIAISSEAAFYTTWSCTLERVRLSDGKIEFVEWIASTVECAPHVQGEHVAAAYTEKGNQVSLHAANGGKVLWQQQLASPVLAAPVVNDGRVLTTSIDGSVSVLDSKSGKIEWSANACSLAPPVATRWGMLLVTPPVVKTAAKEVKKGDKKQDTKYARETIAEVAKGAPEGTIASIKDRHLVLLDPADKPRGYKCDMPTGPRSTLDFQGVTPGVGDNMIVFAHAGKVTAVNPETNKILWQFNTKEKYGFVTPILHDGLVILARKDGFIVALEQENGEPVWCYKIEGKRFLAAPCVYGSRIFITTNSGELISIPTGSDSSIESNENGDYEDLPDGPRIAGGNPWPSIRNQFQKKRNDKKEVEDKAPEPRDKQDADDSAEPAKPIDREQAEKLTRERWDKREERRAKRGQPNGQKYEKKPYPR